MVDGTSGLGQGMEADKVIEPNPPTDVASEIGGVAAGGTLSRLKQEADAFRAQQDARAAKADMVGGLSAGVVEAKDMAGDKPTDPGAASVQTGEDIVPPPQTQKI